MASSSFTPPKSNELIPRMMVLLNVSPASNMAILGIQPLVFGGVHLDEFLTRPARLGYGWIWLPPFEVRLAMIRKAEYGNMGLRVWC